MARKPVKALFICSFVAASFGLLASIFSIAQASTGLPNDWVPTGEDIYFSGGNVGIGTSSPESALSIKNGRIAVSHSGWSPGIELRDDNDNDSFTLLHHRSGDRFSVANKNGEEKLTVLQTGKVGVNTVSPSEALSVENGRLLVSHTSWAPALILKDNEDNDTFSIVHHRSGNRLEFRNKKDDAKMVIYQNGSVCIGACL